jgi:glycosyltransferase involved in cell wall biosynthesis
MKVLIGTVSTPFVRGGAELHAEGLRDALCAAGHEAELVAIPFKWYPPEKILDQILASRLLDITESDGVAIDYFIGLKFPAYLIPHPRKTLWIMHQHRPAYDLWDHALGDLIQYPNGLEVRDAIRQADCRLIPEAQQIYTNSANVSKRLKHYCDIDSIPLYHPPPCAEDFYCAAPADYLFFPSRLSPNKRQHLVVEALQYTRDPVCVSFASSADHSTYARDVYELAQRCGVANRVQFLGAVSEEKKRWLYANALGVIYPPVDEDYGYVTLEAMLASKPVITCTDSGGPLEFVGDGQSGLVAEPTPVGLAGALDRLWADRAAAQRIGRAGRDLYTSLNISWQHVIERLLE